VQHPVVLAHRIPKRVTALTIASCIAVDGTTRSHFLTAEQAGIVERQVDAGRKFRANVGAYWETKKGDSKRAFEAKSSRKSTCS